MSFLRNLVSDLVEKRLWPVALLLVGALVAVPFVLGGGGTEADSAAIATATPATTSTTTATTIRVSEDTNVATIAPTGTKHNPFRQPKAETAATPDDSATPRRRRPRRRRPAATRAPRAARRRRRRRPRRPPRRPRRRTPRPEDRREHEGHPRRSQLRRARQLQAEGPHGHRPPERAAVGGQADRHLPRRQEGQEDRHVPHLERRDGDGRRHLQAVGDQLPDDRDAGGRLHLPRHRSRLGRAAVPPRRRPGRRGRQEVVGEGDHGPRPRVRRRPRLPPARPSSPARSRCPAWTSRRRPGR